MSQWVNICSIDDILPATGVCALLGQQQVAIFRPYHDDRVFAISNIDPFFNASVLAGLSPSMTARYGSPAR